MLDRCSTSAPRGKQANRWSGICCEASAVTMSSCCVTPLTFLFRSRNRRQRRLLAASPWISSHTAINCDLLANVRICLWGPGPLVSLLYFPVDNYVSPVAQAAAQQSGHTLAHLSLRPGTSSARSAPTARPARPGHESSALKLLKMEREPKRR